MRRLYRALLRLLPREFRGDYGDAMAADFDDRRADGARGVLRREIGPLLSMAAREHAGQLRRDVRDALRQMRKAPAFTLLAVLMLGLGTGVNVGMFSIIDAVMLRSPFTDRDRVAQVLVRPAAGRNFTAAVPYDQVRSFETAASAFDAVGAMGGGTFLMTGPGEFRRPDFECVTAAMFSVLGTPPRLGRVFGPDDDRSGAAAAIVLSDTFARELGDPASLLGTRITLNQAPVTVVGVMPRGFGGPYSRSDTAGWMPLHAGVKGRGFAGCAPGNYANVFVRVRKGLTLVEATRAFSDVQLLPIDDVTFREQRTPFLILTGAVAAVLLIACLNVGGLQLERSLSRRRELALRVALGASRGRLIRHALTENLVLALAGAAAGIALTSASLGAIVSVLPANLPHLDEIELNYRALAAAIAVAAAGGLIAGLMPVLQTRDVAPARDLSSATRSATARTEWTRRAFVVIQISLSIVVLIGAGLMIRTFATLRPSSPGFSHEQKLLTLVRRPGGSPEDTKRFFDRLFDRVRELPGVRHVVASSYLPMAGTVSTLAIGFDGDKKTPAWGASATPDYFDVMNIPIVSGRSFTAADVAGSPAVAIVNQALAARLRPDAAVVGMVVSTPPPRVPDARPVEWVIAGVVANTRSLGADTRARPEFYVPFAQNPVTTMHMFVQTDRWRDPAAIAQIRQTIRAVDADIVLAPVERLTTVLNRRVSTPRFGAWLLGVFATLAVLLAAIGLMTTMGWWVRQRTRELGVRVALGASHAQVMRLVLRQGVSMAAAGVVIGTLAAAGVTRYMTSWIYGVTPLDTATFASAIVLMLVVGVAAVYVPARRALRVDPVVALRAE